jgi:hypothetical protein
LPEPEKYPVGSVYVRGLTSAKIRELKSSMTGNEWSINYLLTHKDNENALFKEINYKPFDKTNKRIVAFIDTAYTGKNNTALTIGYYNPVDRSFYVTGWTWRKSIVELYQKISALLFEYNCGTVYIEDNADKGLSVIELRKFYPSVKPYHTTMNKTNKINAYVYKNWNNIFFDDNCDESYCNEILDYEEYKEPDDAVDSLAGLLINCQQFVNNSLTNTAISGIIQDSMQY